MVPIMQQHTVGVSYSRIPQARRVLKFSVPLCAELRLPITTFSCLETLTLCSTSWP
jgi:hypothetical protein